MSMACKVRDELIIEASVLELADQIFPHPFDNLFKELFNLSRGKLKENLSDISQRFGFDNQFQLKAIVARITRNKDILRNSVYQSIHDLIPVQIKQAKGFNASYAQAIKNYQIGLSSLAIGYEINIIGTLNNFKCKCLRINLYSMVQGA